MKRRLTLQAISALSVLLAMALPMAPAYGEEGTHFFKLGTIFLPRALTPEKMVALRHEAAEQGDPGAQFRWAERLYKRVKQQRAMPAAKGRETFFEEAFFWYVQAADQGHAGAQRRIADFHATGEGITRDPNKSAHLYRLSADQGDARAELRMGVLNEEGLGLPANLEKAIYWYERAARRVAFAKVANVARYRLGKILATTRQKKNTLIDAYMWFDLAAKKGHKEADMERLKIEKRLSLAQIVKAKKQARQWTKGLESAQEPLTKKSPW